MSIVFWTSADSQVISRTIGTVLKSLRPNVPEHSFVEFDGSWVVSPQPGEVVMACGSKVLELLKKGGLVPKNRTINSLRENPIPTPSGGWYLMSYDPQIVANEPDKLDLIAWDVQLARRLIANGDTKPKLGDYKWVGSYQPLIDRINAKFEQTGKPVDVSFDSETMGLFPWYDDKDIVCCGFTDRTGYAECLYTGPHPDPVPVVQDLPDQLNWLFTTDRVKMRLANGKYDMLWIREKWGIRCTNFKFDTLLVGTLLDENRSNSLKLHAKTMTTMGGYDDDMTKKDMASMETVPLDKLLTYQGADIDVTHQVADQMRAQLMDDQHLAAFYVTILHPAARAFEEVERRGVLIDQEKYAQLGDDLTKEIKRMHKEGLDMLPRKLRLKYLDKISTQMESGKSPFTGAILKDFFFGTSGLGLKPLEVTEKTKEPSTAKSHLKKFLAHPDAGPFVKMLEELGSAEKTMSTYVTGFLKHVRPDGRFHPSYMLFHGGYGDSDDESGTVTGRLSCKDPAFQTVPKKTKWATRLRECFIAPLGKVILQCDYSQGELRVVACVGNEKNMIQAYRDGKDLHAMTGAQLGGVPYEEFITWDDNPDKKLAAMFKDFRQQAKAGNFGLLYGMGVDGFIAYAWANYGLVLTYAEAEKIRNEFFELYPGLTAYHEQMRSFAKQWEHVRSPLGRIRHLPMIKSWDKKVASKAERQAINSPIQSALSDMMLWSIATIEAEAPEVDVVGTVHDSLVAYVDADKVVECAKTVTGIMASLPLHKLGWKPELPFPADAEAGINLATVKKLALAA